MGHIMLDLETLGRGPDAVIVSIGAVEFSIDNPCISDFYVCVEAEGQAAGGAVIDASTVLWWLQQPQAARGELISEAIRRQPLGTALESLAAWVRGGAERTYRVWGNGSSFDCVILRRAYERCGVTTPWDWWNDRCYRTLTDLCPTIPRIAPEVPHHALHDARAQAQHAHLCLRALADTSLI